MKNHVLILGKPGSRVKDMVVSPDDYFKKHNYKLNSKYYIENVINNALGRIFDTFKVDINVRTLKFIYIYLFLGVVHEYTKRPQ